MTDATPLPALVVPTADIVSAYVANNAVRTADVPALIADVHDALVKLGQPAAAEPVVPREPAVPVKKSVHHDYLISLEDGKRYKTLRRHLTTRGMTPDTYRAKWGLPADYPMTCASYSERRSDLAKEIGLGTKPPADGAPAAEQPKAAGRTRKAATEPLQASA